jgi:hypothetical protein
MVTSTSSENLYLLYEFLKLNFDFDIAKTLILHTW